MIPSTHYYVLSLGAEGTNATRRALMRTVDACFGYYDSRERLGLVLVGDEELQSAFDSVTTHGSPIISEDVDIRDVNDDAVDAVIERVLGSGGNAVFVHSGALADRGRIALLLRKMRQT